MQFIIITHSRNNPQVTIGGFSEPTEFARASHHKEVLMTGESNLYYSFFFIRSLSIIHQSAPCPNKMAVRQTEIIGNHP